MTAQRTDDELTAWLAGLQALLAEWEAAPS
jgi:hypothetical protein